MLTKIDENELKLILENHAKFLASEGGCCADLRAANLIRENLQGANLTRANLQGAKLWYTNLQGTNLEEANLWGANLWGANLQGANLQGANLQGATLCRANLKEANLQGANLKGVDIKRTIGDGKNIFNVFNAKWEIVYTSEIMAIGCKSYTIDEWLNFNDDKILKMYRDALEWWKKWKPIIVQCLEANGIKQ